MEIIHAFELNSTEGFRFETCWIETSNENDARIFLAERQINTRPNAAKIQLRDIKFILSKITELDNEPSDLIVKVVIQKGNTEVSPETRRLGGIWANLVFLIRVFVGGTEKWMIYGVGKGRYRKYPLLEIER